MVQVLNILRTNHANIPLCGIITRLVLREQYFEVIEQLLDQFPVVCLLGPCDARHMEECPQATLIKKLR